MSLLTLTSATDFLGLCTTLWLAGYLLSRGFRSRTTLRAVVILFLLSVAFTEGYISLIEPEKSHYVWFLGAFLLAVVVWYNLTYGWLPRPLQRQVRWTAWGIYGVGLLTFVILLLPGSDLAGPGPGLLVGFSRRTLFGLGNSLMLLPAAIATLVNFRNGTRYGIGPGFRTVWVAALFGALSMTYGALAYLFGIYLPRLGLDVLVIIAMLMLGLAVARHQAFVERRTTLQDLPVSAVAIALIMGGYAIITQRAGFSGTQTALVASMAVFSHSVYDLAREWLDRLVHRQDSKLRHHLRKLARDVAGPDVLAANLQTALGALVHTLQASGGFVAVKQGEHYSILASVRSLPLAQQVEPAALNADGLRPGTQQAGSLAWLAPARAGEEQLGAIGLGARTNHEAYREEDLDLLVEAADAVGQLLQAEARQARSRAELISLTAEVQSREVGLQAGAQDLIAAIEEQIDRNFERMVEQALQHLSDYTLLGQSGLVAELMIGGATHIERGKVVRASLMRAIDGLRPAGARPAGVPPREWHSYLILHEAYVEDVPNRDIMSQLYVSEGTFNRQRRKALRAVARSLLEARRPAPVVPFESLARADQDVAV
jgi:hypothetical protein